MENSFQTYVNLSVKMPLYPRRPKYLSNLIYPCLLFNTNTRNRTEAYNQLIEQMKTQATLKNFDLIVLLIVIAKV